MKMTDQMERDFIQAEIANGHANYDDSLDADGLVTASTVMGVLFAAAMFMIWLGR